MKARHRRVQRHVGGRGALLTLADQLISSASNFLLGVLIARAGGSDSLGTFGIAFLVWLAVVGSNRALVTEPMTVTGSTDHRNAQLPDGLMATLVLGLGCAAALGVTSLALEAAGINATALLALAPWIPSLLAQDYCRSMAFRLQRPDQALWSDASFALVQVAASIALLALGIRSTFAFIAVWGLGATIGAVVGIVLIDAIPRHRAGFAHLRRLWPRSKWFLAEFGTAFPADQGYLLLLPILLGTDQFGLYRSGTGLIGPIVVVLVAGGNIGLPESVRRLREQGMPGLARYARMLTIVVFGVTIVYCGLVAIFAEFVLRLVYGAEFVAAADVTRMIAVQYALMAVSFGFGQAVKAAGQMRSLWVSRVVSAIVSISAVTFLADMFGLIGAGVASITAGFAYSLGVVIAYLRLRQRSAALGLQPDTATTALPAVATTADQAEQADEPTQRLRVR